MTYKQIKLVTGEEFIANVLDVQEDEGVLIISEALKIVEVENIDEGISYFALRPLMAFTENSEKLHIVSTAHVSVETFPSEHILNHYKSTLAKMDKFYKSGKTVEEIEELTEEEYTQFMKEMEDLDDDDSDTPEGENILKFKPKGTFH